MAHQPRRTAPSLGPRPDLDAPAPHGADGPEPRKAGRRSPGLGMEKISLRAWKQSPAEIAKILFGKEPDVDPHTGQLVLRRGPGAESAPFGS